MSELIWRNHISPEYNRYAGKTIRKLKAVRFMAETAHPDLPPNNPPRRFLWIADLAWLVLLSAYIIVGRGLVPLHGDEVTHTFMSRDWIRLVVQPDWSQMFYSPDPADPAAQQERLGVAPLPRYGVGAAWMLAGYTEENLPDAPWNWIVPPEENEEQGRRPDPDYLAAVRGFAALTLAAGVAGLFWLGMTLDGRWLAYVASGLMAVNPSILMNGRRAMAEGPLLGFSLLAVAAAAYLVNPERFGRGWRRIGWLILIGLLTGLAFSAKHNGGIVGLVIAAALAPALIVRQAGGLPRKLWEATWQIGLIAVVALGVSALLMPALWPDPVSAISEGLAYRASIQQGGAEVHYAYATPSEALHALAEELFTPNLDYFDVSAWAPYLAGDILAYQGSIFAGLPYTPLINGVLGVLALTGMGVILSRVAAPQTDGQRVQGWLVAAWFVLTAALTLLGNQIQWQRYYVPLTPIMIVFQSVGAVWLVKLLAGAAAGTGKLWTENRAAILSVGLAGLAGLGIWAAILRPVTANTRAMLFTGGAARRVDVPLDYRFDQQIALLGYDMEQRADSIVLTFYWQMVGDPVEEEFSTIVNLADLDGYPPVSQTTTPIQTAFPVSSWAPGTTIKERMLLPIPPGTPPGDYTLDVGLYSAYTGHSATAYDGAGSPVGTAIPIGTVAIRRPRHPADPALLGFETMLNAPLTGGITLLGSEMQVSSSMVGQPIFLRWGWRADRQPDAAYSARVLWLSSDGSVAASSPDLTLAGRYPTTQWRRGDVWQDGTILYLPGRLSAGNYAVAVQLVDGAGNAVGERVNVGQMTVETPERSFEQPAPEFPTGAAWENGIHLLGFDLDRGDDAINVTLYWQPQEDITTNLKVFIHLFDDNGIAAQVDQVPVDGLRPTAGWAPGEVITDRVSLGLPPDFQPGEYRVRVGWYDALTGMRIPLTGGGDLFILPETALPEGDIP